MTKSAEAPALRRRLERQARIQETACRLVLTHGYDGFTMEDLARAVGVSRRTLFNAVASKEEAVLGPVPEPEPSELTGFTQGGPRGELVPDLVHLIDRVFATADLDDTGAVERHGLLEQAVAHDPKVQGMVEWRFALFTDRAADALCTREGWPEGDLRAQVLARTMLSVIRLSLDENGRRRDGLALQMIFHQVLAAAREVGVLA